ncbi:hypothetical protein [Nocardiopsis valliformis]|uniref:hypothetical protein n=1 Tax=Nocardiopsis valliformis TaxID=239974 RepID=UPI001269550F|nr:hypothetical protein [Nocardiopsis valliformis]
MRTDIHRSIRRAAPVAARGTGQRWLVLGAVSGAVVLLAATGVLPVWPGLVHLVALPPLDLHADLRVLLTATSGPVSFVLLGAAALVARTLVLALLMGGLTRDRITLAAVFYVALVVPLLLAAQVVYISNTLMYSRLFWAGLVVVVLLFLLLAPVPWSVAAYEGGARLRTAFARTWRGGLRLEVTLPYAAAVAGVGVLAHLFPALTIALVPLSAALTALALTALSRPAPARPLVRLTATAAVLALIAAGWITTRGTDMPRPAPPREGSIMLMSGIDSRSGVGDMFSSRTDMLGYDCDQTFYFSYAGPGDGQPQRQARCPMRTGAPYQSAHTQRPVSEQVEVFAEQVRDLPRPLVVAGHSHGAWIAWKAVATGQAPEVDALVLVGPFPESTGGYRPRGEPGPGRPASDLLHLLVPLAGEVDFTFDADAPAAYELLGTTDTPAEIFSLPLPEETRALSVTSSSDLPLKPSGWRMAVDRNTCPMRTPHAYLPTTPAYYEEVNRFLDGEPQPDCPVVFDWAAPLTVPLSTPELQVGPPN